MIGCVVQHLEMPYQDSLYVYGLSGNSQQPLSHSVMLELPRWKPNLRYLGGQDRLIELITGSWSEDIYPGALSRKGCRHVIIVEDECLHHKYRYSVRYVLRNDLLLRLLVQYNGRIMRWENWSKDCARAFQGVPRNDPVQFINVQICGQKVMIITGNRTQRTKHVVVADFDPGTFDTRMVPGTVEKQGTTVAEGTASMFENGWVWTNLPYRSIPISGNIDWDTKLLLGADRIIYTRSGGWKKARYISVQAAYP
ncbi:hypothetical protein PENSPDRAFT_405118 [Peniophora sp. CONT]|nr:hypothetical protein PENSPDRAFT_405118 [Peniophora sp. CONT]